MKLLKNLKRIQPKFNPFKNTFKMDSFSKIKFENIAKKSFYATCTQITMPRYTNFIILISKSLTLNLIENRKVFVFKDSEYQVKYISKQGRLKKIHFLLFYFEI